MTTHQCSLSKRCKSTTCTHAQPHAPNGCDCNAPCGCWPNSKDFKPLVRCIPVAMVPDVVVPKDPPPAGLDLAFLMRQYRQEMMALRQDEGFKLDVVLEELKKAYYAIRRGENYSWQGYDVTHPELLATTPCAREWLQKAQWWHESKGLTYLDQVFLLAVMIGMNHGIDKGMIDGKIAALETVMKAT